MPAGTVIESSAPPGFDYGNARVRAMWSRLLDRAAFDRMLGRGVDQVLEILGSGEYAPDVRHALARARGTAAIHLAVSRNLARTLHAVRGFYGGDAGSAVSLMLGRWDTANVVTLLRAQVVEADAEDAAAMVVPAGAIDEDVALEIARRPGLRAAAGLLVTWGLPDTQTAFAVLHAIPAYESTGDLSVLEDEVVRAWAAGMDETLGRLRRGAEALTPLREEVDQRNALMSLRLLALARERGADASSPRDRFLPGGLIDPGVFAAAASAASNRDAAAALAAPTAAAAWRPALTRWAADGDLPRLQRELQVSLTLRTMSLLRRGDPLEAGVPLAYVFAKENEARNLRIVAYGAASGAPPAVVRDQVVAPW